MSWVDEVVPRSRPRRMPPEFVVGLDLGQANDFTALAIARRTIDSDGLGSYQFAALERMRIAYPAVVEHVSGLLWRLHTEHRTREANSRIRFAIDGTGVGVAVVDMFRQQSLPCGLTAITITGGEHASISGDSASVPKRDLASIVQVLLQSGRFRVSPQLELAKTLMAELLNFRVKISLSGHDTYGAGADWRSSNHDDLVLATALACWLGEQPRQRVTMSDYEGNPIQRDPEMDALLRREW